MQDITKLQVGDTLQLQYAPPSTNPDRYAVRVIGYLPNESIVTSTPLRNGKVMLIREGQGFTVRMLQGNAVLGFSAKVLLSATKPYPHLHLAYPDDVETRVVRNAQRVGTDLQASLINTRLPDQEEQVRTATMIDISLTGARLECHKPLGEEGDILQINVTMRVCESEESLHTLVNICSVKERETEEGGRFYYYGVAFRSLNRVQKLLLCAFVKGQITQNR